MQTMGLIFISVLCFFWGVITMEHWGLPWGTLGGLALFAVPVFGWTVKFRFARRARQHHNRLHYTPRKRKVFLKVAIATYLLLAVAMAVGFQNLMHHFAPEWVSYLALLGMSPFTGWGMLLVPLLVGKACQLWVDSAPLPINPEAVANAEALARSRKQLDEEYRRAIGKA